jgi:hypothetical protein
MASLWELALSSAGRCDMDIIYIGLMGGLVVVSIGLIILCEKL